MSSVGAASPLFIVGKFNEHLAEIRQNQKLENVIAAIAMIKTAAEVNKLFLSAKSPPFSFFIEQLSEAIQSAKKNKDFYDKASELLTSCRAAHILPVTLESAVSPPKSTSAVPKPLFNMLIFNAYKTKLRNNREIQDLETILKQLSNAITALDESKNYVVFFEKDRFQTLSFFIKQLSEVLFMVKEYKEFYSKANALLTSFEQQYR